MGSSTFRMDSRVYVNDQWCVVKTRRLYRQLRREGATRNLARHAIGMTLVLWATPTHRVVA